MIWDVKLYVGGKVFTESVHAVNRNDAIDTAKNRNPKARVIGVNPTTRENSMKTNLTSTSVIDLQQRRLLCDDLEYAVIEDKTLLSHIIDDYVYRLTDNEVRGYQREVDKILDYQDFTDQFQITFEVELEEEV